MCFSNSETRVCLSNVEHLKLPGSRISFGPLCTRAKWQHVIRYQLAPGDCVDPPHWDTLAHKLCLVRSDGRPWSGSWDRVVVKRIQASLARKAHAAVSKGLVVETGGRRVWHEWTKGLLSPDWDGVDFSEECARRLQASTEPQATETARADAEVELLQAQLAALGQTPVVPPREHAESDSDSDSGPQNHVNKQRQEWTYIRRQISPSVGPWDSLSQLEANANQHPRARSPRPPRARSPRPPPPPHHFPPPPPPHPFPPLPPRQPQPQPPPQSQSQSQPQPQPQQPLRPGQSSKLSLADQQYWDQVPRQRLVGLLKDTAARLADLHISITLLKEEDILLVTVVADEEVWAPLPERESTRLASSIASQRDQIADALQILRAERERQLDRALFLDDQFNARIGYNGVTGIAPPFQPARLWMRFLVGAEHSPLLEAMCAEESRE
ncbi:hypothetical protein QBC39DRAFT_374577 [Podospora conica]|nr:hypothetical protein QBC39DRAFT_374577 [Schizothecium conicum]